MLKERELATSQYWVMVPWGMRYPWYMTYGIYTMVPYSVIAELEPFLWFAPILWRFWAIFKKSLSQLNWDLETWYSYITCISTCAYHMDIWILEFWNFCLLPWFKPWNSHFLQLHRAPMEAAKKQTYHRIHLILGYLHAGGFRYGCRFTLIRFLKTVLKIGLFSLYYWLLQQQHT